MKRGLAHVSPVERTAMIPLPGEDADGDGA